MSYVPVVRDCVLHVNRVRARNIFAALVFARALEITNQNTFNVAQNFYVVSSFVFYSHFFSFFICVAFFATLLFAFLHLLRHSQGFFSYIIFLFTALSIRFFPTKVNEKIKIFLRAVVYIFQVSQKSRKNIYKFILFFFGINLADFLFA